MTSKPNPGHLPGTVSTVTELSDSQVHSLLSFGLSSENREPELVDALKSIDQQTAQQVVEDLRSRVTTSGPLSIQRLTGATSSVIEELAGSNMLDALTSNQTSCETLQVLVAFGEQLESPTFPISTRCTGLMIAAVAKSALFSRHSLELDATSTARIQRVFEAIELNPYLSEGIGAG